MQPFGGRCELRRRDSVEANPATPTVQLFKQGTHEERIHSRILSQLCIWARGSATFVRIARLASSHSPVPFGLRKPQGLRQISSRLHLANILADRKDGTNPSKKNIQGTRSIAREERLTELLGCPLLNRRCFRSGSYAEHVVNPRR